MSGARRTLPGNFAANAVDFIPPNLPGLLVWTYFGTQAGSNVNLAGSGVTLSNIGAGPSYNVGYGRFQSGTTALATSIVDGAALLPITLIGAVRWVAGLQGNVGGTYTSVGGQKGMELIVPTASVVRTYAAASGGAFGDVTAGGPLNGSTFRLVAGVATGVGSPQHTYDLTSNLAGVGGSNMTTYVPNTGASLNIGSDNVTGTAVSDLAFFAAYTGALSQPQLLSLVPSIRAALARRSIILPT
ncbi:MAG: hypothetical protein WDN25_13495 [Acetobacteraceae bacterium]